MNLLDPGAKMIDLALDGRPISVPVGTTIWEAARQHGIDVNVFCAVWIEA